MFWRFVSVALTYTLLLVLLQGTASAVEWQGGLLVGYSGGPGGQVNGMVSHLSPGLPLALRLGLGYTSVDPGHALGARKIFINDATNGTPQQKGWFWDFRFDFVYAFTANKMRVFNLYLGPRYASYNANFNFIGGNENFDVNSGQWGLGGGLEGAFPMGHRADLVITTGLDYYPDSALSGHDTTYAPGGEDVNSRKGYSYSDADEVINEPKLEPRFMIGVNYRFGQ